MIGESIRIIGVAGGSASGKTTLAKATAEASQYPVKILSMDDFFLKDQSRGPFTLSPSDGLQHFDRNHPDAFDIERLIHTICEVRQAYSEDGVLLVEGVFALYFEQLVSMMDLRVYVDLAADQRITRKIERNFLERGQAPQITIRNYNENGRAGHYQYVEATKERADIVFLGDRPLERSVKVLCTLINGLFLNPPTR